MEKYAGNSEGAITGWAFSNRPMPAENRLPKIASAIKTPVPGVFQAGQWTYSPSGLPTSILTGKLAADRVIKELT
jgi:phytoene dehydrogenase-like protein